MSNHSDLPFTAEDVAEILSILETAPYDELHLETDRFKLSLKRGGQGGWSQETQTLIRPDVAAAAEPAAAMEKPKAAPAEKAQDGLLDIPAPMVGTFYRAPKPGAEPFVKVGSNVKKDTIIAIIEVMKLMNSIRAEVEGEVVEICVDNGVMIEQGQTLMRVKPGR